jgi:uncharacterized coiled-coil protein SlyX
MDQPTIDAVNNVQVLARQFKAVTDLAAVLTNISNLDTAVAETQTRLDRMREECNALEIVKATSLANIENMKAQAEHIVAEARASAQGIVDVAGLAAEQVKADAARDAAAAIAEAQAELNDVLSQIAVSAKTLEDIDQVIAGRQAHLDEINAQVAAITARLTGG